MKNEKEKKNVYIKIMYKEPFLIPYTLRNTIATIEGWLNIENLMWVDLCGFFEIFSKYREKNGI